MVNIVKFIVIITIYWQTNIVFGLANGRMAEAAKAAEVAETATINDGPVVRHKRHLRFPYNSCFAVSNEDFRVFQLDYLLHVMNKSFSTASCSSGHSNQTAQSECVFGIQFWNQLLLAILRSSSGLSSHSMDHGIILNKNMQNMKSHSFTHYVYR